jgi:hypothetical protein
MPLAIRHLLVDGEMASARFQDSMRPLSCAARSDTTIFRARRAVFRGLTAFPPDRNTMR